MSHQDSCSCPRCPISTQVPALPQGRWEDGGRRQVLCVAPGFCLAQRSPLGPSGGKLQIADWPSLPYPSLCAQTNLNKSTVADRTKHCPGSWRLTWWGSANAEPYTGRVLPQFSLRSLKHRLLFWKVFAEGTHPRPALLQSHCCRSEEKVKQAGDSPSWWPSPRTHAVLGWRTGPLSPLLFCGMYSEVGVWPELGMSMQPSLPFPRP